MKKIPTKNIILLGLGLIIVFSPTIVFGQTYESLVDFPGSASEGLDGLVNSLYALSITLAALLAVIKIIVAGVKWMMSDIVTSKSEAKNDIKGAIVGLLIVLSAVMILTIINPNLAVVDLGLNSRINDFSVNTTMTTDNELITDVSGYSTEQTVRKGSGRTPSTLLPSARDEAIRRAVDDCEDRDGSAVVSGTNVICTLPAGN